MWFCHGEYSLCPSLVLQKNGLFLFNKVQNYFDVLLSAVNLKDFVFLHRSVT